MGYWIDADSIPGILQVVFEGEITVVERAESLQAAAKLMGPRPRVLLDFRKAIVVSASEHIALRHAKSMAIEYASRPGMRIAYLSNPDDQALPTVEMMAAGRGYFYQRFHDRAKALQWLSAGDMADV